MVTKLLHPVHHPAGHRQTFFVDMHELETIWHVVLLCCFRFFCSEALAKGQCEALSEEKTLGKPGRHKSWLKNCSIIEFMNFQATGFLHV